jgi:ubiquitin-like modifier-activating enzyme ATG7
MSLRSAFEFTLLSRLCTEKILFLFTFGRESYSYSLFCRPPQHNYSVPGTLSNFNTVEAFKNLDRKALLKKLADDIWADIDSGAAARDPSRLARWSLTAFSDLKKYRFSYWFAFPAITPPSEKSFTTKSPPTPLNQYFAGQLASITESLIASREANRFAFLVKKTGETVQTADLSEWSSFWTTEPEEDRVIAFATPSSSAGWPLRNLLVLLKHKLKLSAATILQVRCDRSDVKNFSASDVIQVDLFGGERTIGFTWC